MTGSVPSESGQRHTDPDHFLFPPDEKYYFDASRYVLIDRKRHRLIFYDDQSVPLFHSYVFSDVIGCHIEKSLIVSARPGFLKRKIVNRIILKIYVNDPDHEEWDVRFFAHKSGVSVGDDQYKFALEAARGWYDLIAGIIEQNNHTTH